MSDTSDDHYFLGSKDIQFISSGCRILDCVLGGGFPLGRVSNIVGDRSTGKTLLAMEAAANFVADYDGAIRYCEAEAAFDDGYARALGIPMDNIEVSPPMEVLTVEDFGEDLQAFCAQQAKSGKPGLYILDSLDALSSAAEQERTLMEKNTFGAEKARKMSELFRRQTKDVKEANVHLMVISQIRDNIGVVFGKSYSRSGGNALDFYASQILYLQEGSKETIERKSIKRVIGLNIKARCEKNKIGLPFRDCKFPIMFGFGIDDVRAHIDYLALIGDTEFLDAQSLPAKNYKRKLVKMFSDEPENYKALAEALATRVAEKWKEVEVQFLPTGSKYAPRAG